MNLIRQRLLSSSRSHLRVSWHKNIAHWISLTFLPLNRFYVICIRKHQNRARRQPRRNPIWTTRKSLIFLAFRKQFTQPSQFSSSHKMLQFQSIECSIAMEMFSIAARSRSFRAKLYKKCTGTWCSWAWWTKYCMSRSVKAAFHSTWPTMAKKQHTLVRPAHSKMTIWFMDNIARPACWSGEDLQLSNLSINAMEMSATKEKENKCQCIMDPKTCISSPFRVHLVSFGCCWSPTNENGLGK